MNITNSNPYPHEYVNEKRNFVEPKTINAYYDRFSSTTSMPNSHYNRSNNTRNSK